MVSIVTHVPFIRCVMGQQARRFDAVKGQVLSNLAEMLVRQLEDKWVAALQVRQEGFVGVYCWSFRGESFGTGRRENRSKGGKEGSICLQREGLGDTWRVSVSCTSRACARCVLLLWLAPDSMLCCAVPCCAVLCRAPLTPLICSPRARVLACCVPHPATPPLTLCWTCPVGPGESCT
jgi:hypothetical protein